VRAGAFWRSFGPGLLWAGAAIGVSHLVQSTRAGADAGLALAGVILLALVLKYPFFEFGPRYAAATGSSLVEGYARIGRWALWLYFGITLGTAVIVQTAVVLVTTALLMFALDVQWPLPVAAGGVVAVAAGVLAVGRFRLLDLSIKAILLLLALSTLLAAAFAAPRLDWSTLARWPGELVAAGTVPFAFLLALVGWMPSAIDVSVWSSLWTLAKDRETGTRASVSHAVLDFFVGYAGTGVMAFAFLILGAGVMYGSGTSFSNQASVFSTQLVDMYAATLGVWLRPVVIVAVVTTMLSTTITVVDGFPRAIERSVARLRVKELPAGPGPDAGGSIEGPAGATPMAGRVYWVAVVALGVATVAVLAALVRGLTAMVDFATIVSFLTAPILGYLNLRAVTAPEVPPEYRPGRAYRALAWTGLVLLGGTAVAYLVHVLR
jgi:Mn2+/Fe2+ NRAMP family transporter